MLNDQHRELLKYAAADVVARFPATSDRTQIALDASAEHAFFSRLGVQPEDYSEAKEFFIAECHQVVVDEQVMLDGMCNMLLGEKIPIDFYLVSTGEVIIGASRKITKTLLRKVIKNRHDIEMDRSPIRDRVRQVLKLAPSH